MAYHLYTSYCRGAGFTAVVGSPANVPATTTIDANAPTVTKVTYVTPTSVISSAGSSGANNTGGKWSNLTVLLAAALAHCLSPLVGLTSRISEVTICTTQSEAFQIVSPCSKLIQLLTSLFLQQV